MKKLIFYSIILLCAGMFSTAQQAAAQDNVKVVKIWDKAKHNGFPDLFYFNKYYYATFREGNSHVDNTNDGSVRIIRSKDLKNWETVALYDLDGIDVREARLSLTPQGNILVILAAGVWKDRYESLHPYVSFSDKSGKNFTPLEKASIDPSIPPAFDWIWRVTWHNGVGYGIVYKVYPDKRKGPWEAYLVKTTDGRNYDKVSQLNIDGNPNESTIRFDKNGKMYVMVRRESEDQMGTLAVSEYPYTQWTFNPLSWRLGGPNFLFLNDTQLVIGSRFHEDKKASTVIFVTDLKGNVKKKIKLPSGGDTSYPGMVIRNNKLHVVYYSSHEGKTSIYLAEIPLKDLKG